MLKRSPATVQPMASLGALAGAQPQPAPMKPIKPLRHHGKNLGQYLHPKKKR